MKQKTILIFIISLTLMCSLSSCGTLLKKVSGLKNPRVETTESVLTYLAERGYEPEYCYIQTATKDSATITDNMINGFGTRFMLFDSSGQLYCYHNDSSNCSVYEFYEATHNLKESFGPCETDTITLQEKIATLKQIGNIQDELPESDYYVLYYWSKFGSKKKHHQQGFEKLKEIQENSDPKITFLLVNADLQREWGLKENGKVKLKIRVTRKGGTLSMSDLPFE